MKIHNILLEDYNYFDDTEKTIELLQGDYSQAWNYYLKTENGMWRNEPSTSSESYLLKTPLLSRKAAYANLNIHNEYINNDPRWADFPKRATIGTLDRDRAQVRYGDTYLLLPKNNAKIGVCPQSDIWGSFSKINQYLGADSNELVLNEFYEDLRYIFDGFQTMFYKMGFSSATHIGLSMNMDYERFSKILNLMDKLTAKYKEIDEKDKVEILDRYNGIITPSVLDFLECVGGLDCDLRDPFLTDVDAYGFKDTMDNIFSPREFEIIGINEIKEADREVWIDQPCLMIKYDYEVLKNLREKFKGSS